MVTAKRLVMNLRARGIRVWCEDDRVWVEPLDQLTADEEKLIPKLKPDILAYLASETAGQGVTPSEDPASEVSGVPHPDHRIAAAQSIIGTCKRHSIPLALNGEGRLVIGEADGSGRQPWPSLVMAIEAHRLAVTALVAAAVPRDGDSAGTQTGTGVRD